MIEYHEDSKQDPQPKDRSSELEPLQLQDGSSEEEPRPKESLIELELRPKDSSSEPELLQLQESLLKIENIFQCLISLYQHFHLLKLQDSNF